MNMLIMIKIFQHLLHYLKMQDTTQHTLGNGIKLCIIAQGPGFNKWMVFWGQGKYYGDALLTETGENFYIPEGKYLTDQLNELAVEYIDQASKNDQPFLMYLSHKALHEPFTPPQRHKNLYKDMEIPAR